LLLGKQQARCEKHKSRTSWHGCGTHVSTIDSQYAGLRCSSTRFGEAFLAGSIKGGYQEKPLFLIRSSGIIVGHPGPFRRRRRNRRCPGSRGVA
jgi:hypothetical protein